MRLFSQIRTRDTGCQIIADGRIQSTCAGLALEFPIPWLKENVGIFKTYPWLEYGPVLACLLFHARFIYKVLGCFFGAIIIKPWSFLQDLFPERLNGLQKAILRIFNPWRKHVAMSTLFTQRIRSVADLRWIG